MPSTAAAAAAFTVPEVRRIPGSRRRRRKSALVTPSAVTPLSPRLRVGQVRQRRLLPVARLAGWTGNIGRDTPSELLTTTTNQVSAVMFVNGIERCASRREPPVTPGCTLLVVIEKCVPAV